MLAEFKETFDIPDDYFVAMVTGQPLRNVRAAHPETAGKTTEVQERYRDHFIERHRQLIEETDELREIIALTAALTKKQRRLYLNSLKNNLTVFRSLTAKHGEAGSPLPSPAKD